MSLGPGFPNKHLADFTSYGLDLQQIYEIVRQALPFMPTAMRLAPRVRDGFGFLYGLYYSTNFIPRMAADHYLTLMLRFVNGDYYRWMSISDLGKQCEGRVEIEIAMRYLKYNGYIKTDKESKFSFFPNFTMTEKGLEQAHKVTKRFQHPEFGLSYKPRRLERVASRINTILGRRNTL